MRLSVEMIGRKTTHINALKTEIFSCFLYSTARLRRGLLHRKFDHNTVLGSSREWPFVKNYFSIMTVLMSTVWSREGRGLSMFDFTLMPDANSC